MSLGFYSTALVAGLGSRCGVFKSIHKLCSRELGSGQDAIASMAVVQLHCILVAGLGSFDVVYSKVYINFVAPHSGLELG